MARLRFLTIREQVADLHQQGKSDSAMAILIGCGLRTVRRARMELGLSVNRHPGWRNGGKLDKRERGTYCEVCRISLGEDGMPTTMPCGVVATTEPTPEYPLGRPGCPYETKTEAAE